MERQEPFGLVYGLCLENCVTDIPLEEFVGFQNGTVTNNTGKKIEDLINADGDVTFTCTEALTDHTAIVVGDSNRSALQSYLPYIFSECHMMITSEDASEVLHHTNNKDIAIFVIDERYFPYSLNAYMFEGIHDYGVEYFVR